MPCFSGFDGVRQDNGRHGAVGKVDAVWRDVVALQRPDMAEIFIAYGGGASAQFGNDALNL